MKKLQAAVLLLAVILSLPACNAKKNSSDTVSASQSAVQPQIDPNDLTGLLTASIEPLPNWTKSEAERLTYCRQDGTDTVGGNISLYAKRVPEGTVLAEYVELAKRDINGLYYDGIFTEITATTVNGIEAYEYTFTSIGRTNRFIYLYKDSWVYIIECTAPKAKFGGIISELDTMIATYKLT